MATAKYLASAGGRQSLQNDEVQTEGGDKTIKLWDVATASILRTLTGHSEGVLSIAFSPDGKILASGDGDRTVKLWETSTGREVRNLSEHAGIVLL